MTERFRDVPLSRFLSEALRRQHPEVADTKFGEKFNRCSDFTEITVLFSLCTIGSTEVRLSPLIIWDFSACLNSFHVTVTDVHASPGLQFTVRNRLGYVTFQKDKWLA